MLKSSDIKHIAIARLEDAVTLFNAQRYDGAYYLCGYAIELGLKYRICKTLKWNDYPLTSNEFKKYSSFKTHEVDILLNLSGREKIIKSKFLVEWSFVRNWNPEYRYQPIGKIKKIDAHTMLMSTKNILNALL